MPRRTAAVAAALPVLLASTAIAVGGARPASASGASSSIAAIGSTSITTPRKERPDFDGDGFGDLAIGVPGEDLTGSGSDAGGVNVIYGSSSGLARTGNQFWSQNSAGILGTSADGDDFGASTGWADFNGDGYDDLAVGVPSDVVGGKAAGAVNVIYGSPSGLTSTHNQLWSQDSAGITGVPESGDDFGWSLTGRDFNGDGFGDLAIGIIGENGGEGAVEILYGSHNGLSASKSRFLQKSGTRSTNDQYGFAVAGGDLNGDGFADLAVGVPGQTVSGATEAGAVSVYYGSSGGITTAGSQVWSQASAGIAGDPSGLEQMGSSLSIADFDGDSYGDLAIGIRAGDAGSVLDAGTAAVIFGGAGGLTAQGNEEWSQDSSGVPGEAEQGDSVADVVGADFDDDGFADLAIGFSGEGLGATSDAGAVVVLYGDELGLSGPGSQLWDQNSPSIKGTAGHGDQFGAALAASDFNNNGSADLAVGVPCDVVGGHDCAGAVNVLYGSASNGLSAAGNQLWTQNSAGIVGVSETDDVFGSGL